MLQIRRGLEADRTSFTPDSGEPIWTTDRKELWMGDGMTAGGIFIGGASSGITEEGIVAFPGGGQADATELTAQYNMIDTVASNGDSVKCEPALERMVKEIFNTSANDMDLFPASGEIFQNGATPMAADAQLSIGAGNGIKLVCYSDGVWRFT